MYVGGHSYRHLVVFRNDTGLSEATARPGPVVAGTAVDVAAVDVTHFHTTISSLFFYFALSCSAPPFHFSLSIFNKQLFQTKVWRGASHVTDLTRKSGVSSKNEQMNSSQCS